MIQGRNKPTATRFLSRSKCTWCAIVALLAVTLVSGTGCDEEEAGRAFRDAASSSLETGVKSILDGVIEGMFAVFELGDDGSDSSSSSSSSSST